MPMSPILAGLCAVLLVSAPVIALTVWGRVRYARRLPSFRCRVGPPTSRWRRHRARWRVRYTRAAWVDDVLLLRSGVLRLWLTPLPVGASGDVTLSALEQEQVRGLGPRPVVLRFSLPDVGEVEIAVAAESADRLVGPFLAAALPGMRDARRRHGA
jgi:hypothetical protein